MATNPIELKGLDHVVLRVRDTVRSIDFYEKVLGCTEERRIDELGLIQMRAGNSLIDLVGIDTPLGRAGGGDLEPNGRNLDHFAVTLAAFDFEAIRRHLQAHGVECPDPGRTYGAEGFGPSLYIQDPDGNTVELKGPATAPIPNQAAENA